MSDIQEELTTQSPYEKTQSPKKEKKLKTTLKRLTVYLSTANGDKLAVVSRIMRIPMWQVLEKSFEEYCERLPDADKLLVKALTDRMAEKRVEFNTNTNR